MEKYNIYPSTARALGNVMNTKGTQEEIDCVYCETNHPVLVNNMSVEYDGINWPIFKMEVDSSLYNVTLTLSAPKTKLSVTENVVLTAKALDNKNQPIKGVDIKFYNGSALLSTVTTNDNGVATISYSSSSLTTATITAKFEGSNRYNAKTSNAVTLEVNSLLTSSVTDFVLKQNGNVVLSAPTTNDDEICIRYPIVLNWDVKVNNSAYSSAVCQVWEAGELLDTLPAGQTTYTISPEGGGTYHDYYIDVVQGDTYNGCRSEDIEFWEIPYQEPTIDATISKSWITIGDTVTITGTVLDQWGYPMRGIPVKLHSQEWNYNSLHTQKIDRGVIATANTNNNGVVTFNLTPNAGSGDYDNIDICGRWWYTLEIDSVDCRASGSSNSVVLTMEKVTPTITVSDLTCYEGLCKLSATLDNGTSPIPNAEMYVGVRTSSNNYTEVYATTNSKGVAIFDLTSLSPGEYVGGVCFYNDAYAGAVKEITITILEDKQLTISNFTLSTADGTLSNIVSCINPEESLIMNGTVQTIGGKLVSGLRVNFLLDDNILVSGLTNSQGKVSVSEIAPTSGSYTVRAVVPNSGKYIGCSKEDALIIIEDSTTRACEDYVS